MPHLPGETQVANHPFDALIMGVAMSVLVVMAVVVILMLVVLHPQSLQQLKSESQLGLQHWPQAPRSSDRTNHAKYEHVNNMGKVIPTRCSKAEIAKQSSPVI